MTALPYDIDYFAHICTHRHVATASHSWLHVTLCTGGQYLARSLYRELSKIFLRFHPLGKVFLLLPGKGIFEKERKIDPSREWSFRRVRRANTSHYVALRSCPIALCSSAFGTKRYVPHRKWFSEPPRSDIVRLVAIHRELRSRRSVILFRSRARSFSCIVMDKPDRKSGRFALQQLCDRPWRKFHYRYVITLDDT